MTKVLMILYSWDDFKKEIADVFKDFGEIFGFFKKYTYDILVEKFGATGVNVLFWGLGVGLLMLLLTKVIRN